MDAAAIKARIHAEIDRISPSGMTADDQVDRLVMVVQALAKKRSKPAEALRVLQAARVTNEAPSASGLASVKCVREVLRDVVPTLAQADGVGWSKVVAAVAVEVAPCALDDIIVALVSTGDRRTQPGKVDEGESVSFIVDFIDIDDQNIQVINTYQQVSMKRVNEEFKRTNDTLSRLASKCSTLIDGNLPSELNALWWSQALYSKRLGLDYRDLHDDKPASLIPTMAADLLHVLGPSREPSHASLLVETARRVRADVDTRRPFGEWLEALIERDAEHVPPAFATFVKEDATLFPITEWLLGGENAHSDQVTGRSVVRAWYRELSVGRWYDDQVGREA